MKTNTRFFRFIVGIDQAFNPIVYGGSEDVTISAQSGYNELLLNKNRWKRKAIDWLFLTFFNDEQHCYRSLLAEIDEFPKEADLIRKILAEKGLSDEQS